MHENSIAFLGDIVLRSPVEVRVPLPRCFTVNLEAPLTRSPAHTPAKISLKMTPEAFLASFPVRPAAVNLANNHIFDYGAAGFEDTLASLQSNGIAFFGAGTARDNCNNPVVLSVGGTRVALLGYVSPSAQPVARTGAYACALLEVDSVLRDIASARADGAEFIAVSLHWGVEQVYLPRPCDVALARQLLLGGADIVIGHHAHRIQPWERSGRKAIFYGLGNAIFADPEVPPVESDGLSRPIVLGQHRPWNRRSLAVIADPAARTYAAEELRFDGAGLLEPTGRTVASSAGLARFGYPMLYRLSHMAGRLAYAGQPYLEKRRLPRASHAGSVCRIVASSLFGNPHG
jgi:poly-gamma-glutamate synthesis protein (capsule biosynthesis protein)